MTNGKKEYRTAMTKELVELVSGKDRHEKFMVVLEAMLWGIEVELAGMSLRFGETIGGGYLPLFITGVNKDQVMGLEDMTITWVSENVAKMDDEKFEQLKFQLSSSKAITGFKKKAA